MDIPALLGRLMQERDWTQSDLAERLGTTQATVSRWLGGADPRGEHRDRIRALARESGVIDEARSTLPVLGRIGAGAEIAPEEEQIPHEGLFEVEVPFAVPEDAIAFEVAGDSMWPRYDPGDVVLCWRFGGDAERLVGCEAAVKTADGRRFLKRILRGAVRGTYDLESHNAPPIRGVRLEWAAEILSVVRSGQWALARMRTASAVRG